MTVCVPRRPSSTYDTTYGKYRLFALRTLFPEGWLLSLVFGRDSSHPHMHSEPRQNEFLPEPPDGNVLQHLVSVRV